MASVRDCLGGNFDPPIASHVNFGTVLVFFFRDPISFRLLDSLPLFPHNGSRPRSRSIAVDVMNHKGIVT